MIIIGVTGGIAMGKTFICNIFKAKNIKVYSADDSIKTIYNYPKTLIFLDSLKLDLVKYNKLNKQKIKELLIKDIISFNKITDYLHKEEEKLRSNFIEENKHKNTKIIVLEIPLLFENNLQNNFNYIILANTPKKIQIQRINQSKDLTKKEINVILSKQILNKYKKKHSSYIVNTNQDSKNVEKKINQILIEIYNKEEINFGR
jgi:dephospho-CoA kinase